MRALLQKSCKTCTKSSIETYFYTIRGLAKIAGLDDVPLQHTWINETLFERVKLMPKRTTSKNLAVAALKALRAYPQTNAVKRKIERWGNFVSKASEAYSKTRNTQERTKREASNWPKGGYDAIRKLAVRLGNEHVVQRALQKAPARISFTVPRAVVHLCLLQQARDEGRPRRCAHTQAGRQLSVHKPEQVARARR